LQNRRDLWKGTGRTAEHEAGGLKHRFLSQHYPRDWGILGGGEIATQVRGHGNVRIPEVEWSQPKP
jgi:hypothetical protein